MPGNDNTNKKLIERFHRLGYRGHHLRLLQRRLRLGMSSRRRKNAEAVYNISQSTTRYLLMLSYFAFFFINVLLLAVISRRVATDFLLDNQLVGDYGNVIKELIIISVPFLILINDIGLGTIRILTATESGHDEESEHQGQEANSLNWIYFFWCFLTGIYFIAFPLVFFISAWAIFDSEGESESMILFATLLLKGMVSIVSNAIVLFGAAYFHQSVNRLVFIFKDLKNRIYLTALSWRARTNQTRIAVTVNDLDQNLNNGDRSSDRIMIDRNLQRYVADRFVYFFGFREENEQNDPVNRAVSGNGGNPNQQENQATYREGQNSAGSAGENVGENVFENEEDEEPETEENYFYRRDEEEEFSV